MNDREICDLINEAYFRKLGAKPGDFVSIADLRDHTDPAGIHPDDLAAMLVWLHEDGQVGLITHQGFMTQREREAAIRHDGEWKCLVSIGSGDG